MIVIITNLINPRIESLLELINIATKHVTSSGFLLQHASPDTYPFISKSDGFNAAPEQYNYGIAHQDYQ